MGKFTPERNDGYVTPRPCHTQSYELEQLRKENAALKKDLIIAKETIVNLLHVLTNRNRNGEGCRTSETDRC